ncbi:MAG: wax ester/triacylglycerol synthase family O-acyltransferase [Anaerolineales bacterium]|nr:wax ester/triacylglycerol synthase family O-acyltransferase [Anaerolineales bacterium]
MPKREKVSNVDTAWLHMEHPTNLMMISGVMTFEGKVNFEQLVAVLEERLLPYERFRQRVVQPANPLTSPYWETVPNFDIRDHIYRFTPPVPDQAALQDLSSRLMSTQLDFSKPLWEYHLIENYADGDSALFTRLHHSIGDGIALIRVLLSLTDDSETAPWRLATARASRRRSPLASMVRRAQKSAKAARKVTETVAHEGLEMIRAPEKIVDLTKLGADGVVSLARLVLRIPDPKTVFKGRLGVPKKAAWSEPISLAEVKAVGKATGGTVNDVLLTAMAGGLRRYLVNRGEEVEGLNIRAAIPVNLRPLEGPIELGNKFGLVFLSLPVGIEDSVDRLYELKRRMDALKGSTEPAVAFGILTAMGMTPTEIENIVVDIFEKKATAVMTNVPGPREPIYLADKQVKQIMFWVPQSGRLGLGISILSYAGEVLLGVATDAGLVPDPEMIVEGFHEEFAGMKMKVKRLKSVAGNVAPTKEMVNELHKQLEHLTQAVESLKATRESRPPQSSESTPISPPAEEARCQGVTKSGKPCRNWPREGSVYCHLHGE